MELRMSVTVTAASLLLSALVISNAVYQKKQFYRSVDYLANSKLSLSILYIQALVFVYLFGQVVRKIFFGQLRKDESEHVTEDLCYAVIETCMAFTVFRDDISPKFVAQFTFLLFLKCFHWLAERRVAYMERNPNINILFHCRLISVIGVLSAFDLYLISHAYFTTILKGPSAQIVFGFEYAMMMTILLHISIKYVLHYVELRNAHMWKNKSAYLLNMELVFNFCRVILFSLFMVAMIKLHTFPLFSLRPLIMTLRSFKKSANRVLMSRRLNYLYPDNRKGELNQVDNVCVICHKDMTGGDTKKLSCNHIFHAECLRSFQRQQVCMIETWALDWI